ncbi:unnamed protein product, partial [Prorocentrum cordatum]
YAARKTKAAPGRPHLANPLAEWRSMQSATAARVQAPARGGADSAQEMRGRAAILAMTQEAGLDSVQRLSREVEFFGRRREEAKVTCWRQLLGQLEHSDEEGMEAICAATARWASRAACRAQAQAGRQCTKWVATTWETAQGPVRKHIKGALRIISAKKATGVDALRSPDISRLPDEAIQELTDVINQIETALAWPRQVLTTILALLPKSRGGGRTIGILSLLIKCWSKSRAIRGSSELIAALCRSLLDESTAAMNFCATEALLDLETLLDSIDLILLLEVAEKEAFPATAISLEAQVGPSTRVGDTAFRAEGSQQMTIDSVGGALRIFAEQCTQAELIPSGKSAVASSRNREAEQARKRAKNEAKRVGGTFRLRRRASMGTHAQKLHRAGALHALIYGHQVLGLAPHLMLRLRRQASRAIAGRGFGRCLTTTLALLMGSGDPALALPSQPAAEWLQFWRWAKVKGAISAVICTLMAAGWEVPTAVEWQFDADELWRMSEGPDEVDDTELLEEVAASIKRTWWRNVAPQDVGKGLQAGPDLHGAKRQLARLQRDGDHSTWALQLQVTTSASWTRERQQER